VIAGALALLAVSTFGEAAVLGSSYRGRLVLGFTF